MSNQTNHDNAIAAMKARAAEARAVEAEDRAEHDRRRCAELNRLSACFNHLLPLVYAELKKGVKTKNDGTLYKADHERIDALIRSNLLSPCRVMWRGKFGFVFGEDSSHLEIELSGYYNEVRPDRWSTDPRTIPLRVDGFAWRCQGGKPVPLEQLEVMKTDRTAEALAAARIEALQVAQQISDLNYKLSSLKRVIEC